MENFINELRSNVENFKTENFNNFSQVRFSLDGKNYLLQYSKDKIEWLVKSDNDSFNYKIETMWDNEMNYLGKKDNSIVPNGFKPQNISFSDFKNQFISFIS